MSNITQLLNKKNLSNLCKIEYLVRIIPLAFIFNFQSCGFDIEDPTPPSSPVWVEKSLPEEWPERGIDAHESGGIYLEWEPSLGEDIVAYNIYRASWCDVNDSLGDYDLIVSLELNSIPKLEYIDREANAWTKYYYKLKSQDGADNLSDDSDSLAYSLLPALPASSMSPNGTSETLEFERLLSWRYNYRIAMENYCLTILSEENEFVTRVLLSPGNYVGWDESWQIPAVILLESGQVYFWRIDTGAGYVDDLETAGSESQWASFVYRGE
jgi:hypothetical protein